MCVSVCGFVHVWVKVSTEPRRECESPGDRDIGGCELSEVCAGNQM